MGEKIPDVPKAPNCLQRTSDRIVSTVENFFYWLGISIASRPFTTIVLCLLLAGLWAIGLMHFRHESRIEKLWIPKRSNTVHDRNWARKNFPDRTREEDAIIEADNVLTPSIINKLLQLEKNITSMKVKGNYEWKDYCYIPEKEERCFERSILAIWNYDENKIKELSQDQILNDINNEIKSQSLGFDIPQYLGGIERKGNGEITRVTATRMKWLLRNKDGENATSELEKEFIQMVMRAGSGETSSYVSTKRSFTDIGSSRLRADLGFMVVAYSLIIAYVCLMLGRLNSVQQRIYLSFGGVSCVGLGILVSFGMCSVMGFPYGPLHAICPFLLLGIGIDDMFVIVQEWTNLNSEEKKLPLEERIGITLKNASVSITVTSITDFVAFGIAASSVLPALRSLCAFAALGIVTVYVFQATFFVACFTLDQRRAEAKRDACCCCIQKPNWTPSGFSKRELLPFFFRHVYAPVISKFPIKIIIILITVGLLGFNVWGITNLKQDFNPTWFLPRESYLWRYLKISHFYFPRDGATGYVYIGQLDYYSDRMTLGKIHEELGKIKTLQNVNSWFAEFQKFEKGNDANEKRDSFEERLEKFLCKSEEGKKFSENIEVNCEGKFLLKASRISYKHRLLNSSSERTKSMMDVKNTVKNLRFITKDPIRFAYSEDYIQWEADTIIPCELIRNLCLATALVLLVTLILIADFWICILVFLCIVLTLLDVCGVIYFWDLSIDAVTAIVLIMAIGVTVDYSAHIGHTFMTETGKKNDRARRAIRHIGPAVFNGGISTFLAFILLSASSFYVFNAFFKVFLCVVVFGLFHALAFLPVILSWVGPQPYLSAFREAQMLADAKKALAKQAEANAANPPVVSTQNPNFLNTQPQCSTSSGQPPHHVYLPNSVETH